MENGNSTPAVTVFCLSIHSVPEDNKEDTDAIAGEFLNTEMDFNVNKKTVTQIVSKE